MKIERYGSEKILHMFCGAILGKLKYFLLKAVNYKFDGKYMHEIVNRKCYKSLEAAFIALFSDTTMTLTIGEWGYRHPQIY